MGKRMVASLALLMSAGSVAAADSLDDLLAMPGEAPKAVQPFAFVEGAAARTIAGDDHWSKLRVRLEGGASGSFGDGMRWKLAARVDADHAYVIEDDFYPLDVRRDQRADFMLREAYVDVPRGDWEFRLGRQHIVWGEMVGLFFADVVSARDVREFLLPDFDQLRIPQWAARAEYFGTADFHAELIWIPVATVDDIGKPGSDFYAFRPALPVPVTIGEQEQPPSRLGHGNVGVRLGHLVQGWDLTGFYYNSIDVTPTYYFDPARLRFTPRHDRIQQLGSTVSKDFGSMVFRSEVVATTGRKFNTARTGAEDGLFESDTVDYAAGLDIPVGDRWRFNVQLFGRRVLSADSGAAISANETGGTVMVNRRFGEEVEAEVLAVVGFHRGDSMLRPKVEWRPGSDWRLRAGLDIFDGSGEGLFGRFDESDRAYVEARRSF
ncbi:MAG: hypothetical protein KDG52_09950 [Rhodocyclaceae bacterium]|nr:hypothetical protein [Rhodocyclaceae bacterium]